MEDEADAAWRRVLQVSNGCKEARTRPAERPPERKWTSARLKEAWDEEVDGVDGDGGREEGVGEVPGEGVVVGAVEDFTPTAGANALGPRRFLRVAINIFVLLLLLLLLLLSSLLLSLLLLSSSSLLFCCGR